MMDEIAIRQQVEWGGKKLRGYVDFGTGIDDDGVPVAREALTLLVVGINHTWGTSAASVVSRLQFRHQILSGLHLNRDGSLALTQTLLCQHHPKLHTATVLDSVHSVTWRPPQRHRQRFLCLHFPQFSLAYFSTCFIILYF